MSLEFFGKECVKQHFARQPWNDNCRASHTGDACRGRGRERERGISSELGKNRHCRRCRRCRRSRRCRCCRRSSSSAASSSASSSLLLLL